MALTREIAEHERLRELALESDLLRASFRKQCAHCKTAGFWVEQAISVTAWIFGPRTRTGQILTAVTGYLP